MAAVVEMHHPDVIDLSVQAYEPEIRFPEHSVLGPGFHEWLQPSQEANPHQVGLELVNTRLLMDQLSRTHGEPMTVDMVSRSELSSLFKNHDIVWFMGIYQPSEWSHQYAIKCSEEYRGALPDLNKERDVASSPFAIPEYTPNPAIAANWDAWDQMVEEMHALRKKVFIDYVPNQTAVDHPWAKKYPDRYVRGAKTQYQENPSMYQEVQAEDGNTYYLAHGKDPNFPEWIDTLQLNYANPVVQEEMKKTLLGLIEHADGVRCDMAMLINADTFLRTWGDHLTDEEKQYIRENNFWEKVIPEMKKYARARGKEDFSFAAEAYWDEAELGRNFDYIYGKAFYDHLKRIVINHEPIVEYDSSGNKHNRLREHVEYLMGAVRNGRHYRDVLFTENHDEPRAVEVFGREPSRAVAALTGLIPESIFLMNGGQEDGRRIRPPMQISRLPYETPDETMQRFYEHLLKLKRSKLFQEGKYKMADISTGSDYIIALQVSIDSDSTSLRLPPERELGAVVCINVGHTTATGRVTEIGREEQADVYRLSEGDFVGNPDTQREGGMFIKLLPWETQIIFYGKEKRHAVFEEHERIAA